MSKDKFKKGRQFGKWELSEFIGEGGNGEVWRAILSHDPSKIIAIKLLKNLDNERYTRFKDEIKVLKENADIKGLLKIEDYYLPEGLKNQTPWYSMPLAIPLRK